MKFIPHSTKLFLGLACAALLSTTACGDKPAKPDAAQASAKPEAKKVAEKAEKKKVAEVDVAGLDTMISAKKVSVFDSNGSDTRARLGIIPSATKLSHYKDYKLSELPADHDEKLVFYCSNTHCGASKASAEKALAAGYTDVAVLPVGVKGWKDAGKTTTPDA